MSDIDKQHVLSDGYSGAALSEGAGLVADNLPASEPARRFRTTGLINFFGITLMVAIVVGVGIMLSNLRSLALAGSEREIKNIALVLAKQMERDFDAVASVQNSLIDRIRALGIASSEDFKRRMSDYQTHLLLVDRVVGFPYLGAIVLVDSYGKIFNLSRSWPIPDINAADREYFTALKSDEKLSSFVTKPFLNRATGSWIVQFARKVSGPKGEFIGLVLGAIELQSIERYFAQLALGTDGAISLLHRDGDLLVRYPRIESAIGRPIPGGLAVKLVSNSEFGVGRQFGRLGNPEDRLIAARRIDHYPFLIAATTNVTAVLSDWWRTAYYLIGTAVLALLGVAGGTFLLIRQLKNQGLSERLRAEKVEAENRREQSRRLDAALENMSQGLIMFDSAARLVICNDQYRQIYNLSRESTKPGCSIVDLLKHRVVNRTYSGDPEKYVSALMTKIAQGAMIKDEVDTGDGRIISIVTQPMAGGGWVATHEDITEAKRQEASFRLLFKSNPVPMWVYDVESLRFLAVNDAAVAHYGYSAGQFLAMTVMDIRPTEERERILKFLQVAGRVHDGEVSWRHQKSDKTIIEVVIYSRTLSYEGHSAALVASIDITERKRGDDELRRTKKFIDAVIENVPLPIIVKDVSGLEADARSSRFTLFNRAYEELTGETRASMIGKTAHQVFPEERADLIVQSDNETLQANRAVLTSEHPIVTLHNGTRLVVAKKTIIRDENEKPQYLLTVVDDVTERRQSDARIARMAHYDALTDLPNRVMFNETMNSALEHAVRTGEQFSVLSVDLDGFKEVNDTHGHSAGDTLLREVGGRLQVAAGGVFLARVGGDEFALIVTDGPQPATASALGERLLSAFGSDIEVDGKPLKLGLCIGGAVYPTDGTDSKTLMVNADAALYRAKSGARGSMQFYEPEMGARLRERRALQSDLQLAVGRDELTLHYQPQLRMTGEFTGFEALVRWQCPNRGMVSPGTFIPLAEESGLIIPIGEWVLREACVEAASWSQPLSIAVNISPVQFRRGDLPNLVHSILLETGLTPTRLELEITEGVFIDDFSRAVSILHRLKSLGVQIALDDFGTGYSSLSYLHSFAFDKIKIDRAFIGDLEHNHHSMAITRAVIGLGHSLDVPVLAEGVETDAQHAFLVREGCDEVQGYFTGRPLPIADYASLVGRHVITRKKCAMAG